MCFDIISIGKAILLSERLNQLINLTFDIFICILINDFVNEVR